ncbi:cytochrome-c peroxidase [Nitratireductor kimnyeongensis]|uniref:Cytochrome-c peroxidase n=1 Tax=Nitratireductor kimnyeongensis TaxID=430679 RepID=A0ABW0T2N5_9HYPH|nr:cytochrome c peroxidase [Nitratireductor kimnyeongensis]QZZ35349.1 methylamine utilization protein [Nitratireductor kimnyeongensis]
MKTARRHVAMGALCGLLALSACDAGKLSEDEKAKIASLSIDALAPVPPAPGNRFSDDPQAADFGRLLFFDEGLSGTGTISCATCHIPDQQFQDGRPRGVGSDETDRRTMPLEGVAWNIWQFWDGRRDSLWAQALTPLEDPREHGGDRTAYARHIAEAYAGTYQQIFGSLPDFSQMPENASPLGTEAERAEWSAMKPGQQEAVNRVFSNIGKAIEAFERTLVPSETRFDRFARAIMAGNEPEGDAAFSDLELEGLRLFIGKANCLECHNGPRFTDDHFHNTGVPPVAGLPEDLGRALGVSAVQADPFNCLGRYSDAAPDACEALRFMKRDAAAMERAYKTPSLRGVAGRPPYMHAGQIATLDAVIDHYSSAPDAASGQSEIRGVVFTDRGRQALIAFLKTLDATPASDP